jgi:epoxyqueuosine reductase QueG
LGWIGKAAILVTPKHGPRVRLVTVFTDMPLQTGEPITRCRCGDCTECVEACPGGVISGQLWEAGMPREAMIDAHLCQAASHRVTLERTGQKGPCGMCVAVCPWGRS